MNKDKILNMPAGREMDALILEHVFGAKWYNRNGRNFLLMSDDVIEWDGTPGRIESKISDYIGGFNWSVDIVKAWGVVEHILATKNKAFQVYASLNGWCAIFGNWPHNCFQSEAKTAPLAICRAALLAVCE